MAFANTDRTLSFGLAERFSALRATAQEALGRHRVYRQTLQELDALNDRELADLGISRSDIPRISREAANGAAPRN